MRRTAAHHAVGQPGPGDSPRPGWRLPHSFSVGAQSRRRPVQYLGVADSPNITIPISSGDYLDMLNGKLDGQMAFMSGKLKIKGDMSLAMKLKTLFL